MNRFSTVLLSLLFVGCGKQDTKNPAASPGRTAQDIYERSRFAYASNDLPQAEKLALESAAKARQEKPLVKSHIISALQAAAIVAEEQQHFAKALEHCNEAATLTDQTSGPLEWAGVHGTMAHVLDELGRYAEAEKLLREVTVIESGRLGPEHPKTLQSRMNLANTLSDQNKSQEAETEHRQVLKIKQRLLGPEHPEVLISQMNLALTLNAQGKYEEAEAQLRATLQAEDRVFGREHPETALCHHNLAQVLFKQAQFPEAEEHCRAALRIHRKVFGPEHSNTVADRNTLALILAGEQKYAEAETEFRDVIRLRTWILGPEHPDTLDSRCNLALCLQSQGKHKEAVENAKLALNGARKVLPPNDVTRKFYERVYQDLTGKN